jgi:ketol-acid reductoisomerase
MNDTTMFLFIPCTAMMPITGTWTEVAGQVAGTICKHKAATAETSVVHIPIPLFSNSAKLKGSMIKTIVIDYEIQVAACTSVTAALKLITRGAEGAVAVVTAPAVTQDLTAATDAATVEQHRLTTKPKWIDDDEEYKLELTFVAAATSTIDVLGAVVNFTLRD